MAAFKGKLGRMTSPKTAGMRRRGLYESLIPGLG
jgi:hypothetical protein